jgi:hypothetical protein
VSAQKAILRILSFVLMLHQDSIEAMPSFCLLNSKYNSLLSKRTRWWRHLCILGSYTRQDCPLVPQHSTEPIKGQCHQHFCHQSEQMFKCSNFLMFKHSNMWGFFSNWHWDSSSGQVLILQWFASSNSITSLIWLTANIWPINNFITLKFWRNMS